MLSKFKQLKEDMEKKEPELIINWPELIHFADQSIKEMGINIYR